MVEATMAVPRRAEYFVATLQALPDPVAERQRSGRGLLRNECPSTDPIPGVRGGALARRSWRPK